MQATKTLVLAVASLSIAGAAAGQRLSVEQTDRTIVLRQDGRDVLTYNKRSPQVPAGIDPVYHRSGCLHPVLSPQGRAVTEMFPVDHPHQHGIYSAWVKTSYGGDPVDFWNSARKTGRVFHQRVVSVFGEQDAAGFEVDLIHQVVAKQPVDVLCERWRITVHAIQDDLHCFDLETKQSALTDTPLVIDQYHYGGVALRGPTRWLTSKNPKADDSVSSPSGFLNDLGSDRIEGNHQHAKWVALWGEIDGHPVSIAVLSHAENFRAPQAARLHPTKPYFCFAPCVDDAFVIDQDHPYVGKYRFLITDTMPDPALIQKQWDLWCGG
jgi:hypothetical protein